MPAIYLSLGSNIGDRLAQLQEACDAFTVFRRSAFYETEPVGYLEQAWFINMVVEIETDRSPRELLQYCQSIEVRMGRTREIHKGPRTIDIDILFYANLVLREADLIIPHPEIPDRRFVLEPMNEIAPDFIHPLLNQSIAQLLKACADVSVVNKL